MPPARQVVLLLAAFLLMPVTIAGYQLWAHAAVPRQAEILGIVGNIGEWEMTATLQRHGDTRELAGPMTMKHIGWCSQDGPLEKAGKLQVTLARMSASMVAKVHFDGVECSYEASLSDAYTGKLVCPDRRPVQMLMWVR